MTWLNQNGGDSFHVHGGMFQRRDEPDLCGEIYSPTLGQWIHFKIEVKTPVGKPTPGQLLSLRMYHKRGYLTGIVTSVDELAALVKHWENYKQSPYIHFGNYLHSVNFKDTYNIYESPDRPNDSSRPPTGANS